MRPAFLELRPGSVVSSKGRHYKIKQVVDLHSVMAVNLETGRPDVLTIEGLKPVQADNDRAEGDGTPAGPDLQSEDWVDAQKRFKSIEPLLKNPYRTREDAEAAAEKAGVHVNTLYTWLRKFQESGHVSSLIPEARGRRRGTRLLDPETEAVIASAIDEIYATKQRNTAQAVVTRVMEVCRKADVTPPHPNTVRNRIRERPLAEMLRKRGRRDKARNEYEPIQGEFPDAEYPFQTVQVDHTPADVIIVDDETRQPLGRPWVTLGIDVYSRMVAGWYVSLESPSTAAVGICLTRAMLPKDKLLVELDVPGEWPVCGKIGAVHVDNAREFRGVVLERACAEYGIDVVMRPVKTPHYGGHIERLMGTMANQVRTLPGTTFRSPEQRKGYDSDKEAAMTLKEFEAYLVDFFVNVYHQKVHTGQGAAPIRRWEQGVLGDDESPGRGVLTIPGDPERLCLDFLPFEERTVQPYGIVLDRMHYFHEVLVPWINTNDPKDAKHKRRFVIRRDPRDISRVHFLDPESNQYYSIPCRNTSRPAVSLWEWRAACKRADAEGREGVDEDAIFEALGRMRQRTEKAVKTTKAQRRARQRAAAARKHAGQKKRAAGQSAASEAPAAGDKATTTPATPIDDVFAVPVEPFSDERV